MAIQSSKSEKLQEEDRLAIFKPGLWRTGFFGCGKEWYHFQQELPYMAKLSRGKIFTVVHKTHYSLENFHGASGPCHYVLYTANDSRGKLTIG